MFTLVVIGAFAAARPAAISLPPLAQNRLRLRTDGHVLVELETVWRDGNPGYPEDMLA